MAENFPPQMRKNRLYEDDDDVFAIYIAPAQPIPPAESLSPSDLVSGRVSPLVAVQLSSTYGPLWSSGLQESAVGKLLTLATGGTTTVVQESTRKLWQGSTGGSITFELSFTAKSDPRKDVVEKVKKLYRLVMPTRGGKDSISPLLIAPPLVNIDIPNVISLTNVYITSVNFSQMIKLMKQPGEDLALPMKAEGSITIEPQYMFLSEDVDFLFPTTPSGGA